MAGLALNDEGLRHLVDAFYERVRADPELGPIFNDAIADWPEHLEKLSAFWSSVMLTSGRYKGQPVPAHVKHKDRITPALFDRWLGLWKQTTDDLMMPEAAAMLQDRAARIAQSLQLAMFFRLDDQPTPRPVAHAVSAAPYRSTPVFNQDSLPKALRARHQTKAGVWGVIRVLEGRLRLTLLDPPSEREIGAGEEGLVLPEQPHFVTPLGAMTMQVDFYDRPPEAGD